MGRPRGSYSRSRSNSVHEHGESMSKQENRRRRSPSRSQSRSPSPAEERGSRSRSRHRRHSRSRSRSDRRRYRTRSRSGSYERCRYDDRRRGSRSPMSRRKRHAGDREKPKVSKCLGVFGLSLYTQEQDLRQAFEKYGPVDELQIVYDHQTGKSRGFAFIYMHSLHDAKEAKEMAPGTEIDGRPIRVDYSITERAHTPTPGVYLGKPTSRSGGYKSDRGRSPYYSSRRYSRSRSRSRSRSYHRY